MKIDKIKLLEAKQRLSKRNLNNNIDECLMHVVKEFEDTSILRSRAMAINKDYISD